MKLILSMTFIAGLGLGGAVGDFWATKACLGNKAKMPPAKRLYWTCNQSQGEKFLCDYEEPK